MRELINPDSLENWKKGKKINMIKLQQQGLISITRSHVIYKLGKGSFNSPQQKSGLVPPLTILK